MPQCRTVLVCWRVSRGYGAENGACPSSFERTQSVAIIGGGPGGYEAALAGAQLGAEVTRRRAGRHRRLGGASPTSCRRSRSSRPPSAVDAGEAGDLGVQLFAKGQDGKPAQARDRDQPRRRQQAAAVARPPAVRRHARVARRGGRAHHLRARPARGRRTRSSSRPAQGGTDFDRIEADTLVVSAGSSPRELPTAKPDGERILTWTQLYDMQRSPSTSSSSDPASPAPSSPRPT